MKLTAWLIAIVVVILTVGAQGAQAQVQVTVVIFSVPAGVTIVTEADDAVCNIQDTCDRVLFTGERGATTGGGNCVGIISGVLFPFQNVVVVGRGRPARPTEVVTIEWGSNLEADDHVGEPLPPGTRVSSLQRFGTGDCTIDGVAYSRYSGIVD